MKWHHSFIVLVVDDELDRDSAATRALEGIVEELNAGGFEVMTASTGADAMLLFKAHTEIGCVVLDWDMADEAGPSPSAVLDFIRRRNPDVPVFLTTDRLAVAELPLEVVRRIQGYIWLAEDTPTFIAGRIEQAVEKYTALVWPPFFKELVEYAHEYKYSWHTPGHMGGVAFLKSPVGRLFFQFFGENTLRADLSVSVPELGSLLEHSEVVGQAERAAAKVFGADHTYFVTNGTSTANKMVWQGTVTPDDAVLVDRNCHKSILHSIILTRTRPVYLIPSRNQYGIIGPIHLSEFGAVADKIDRSPLVSDKGRARLAVVTNSTYDGLCYHAGMIRDRLGAKVDNLHFDEAWYAYACRHPLYAGRYGMHPGTAAGPTVFATQSTHKLLAAFSQASMVHVQAGAQFEPERFNEAFMMHTSTSPQYGIIASLDVAARMMAGPAGRILVQETIDEAVSFRQKMARIQAQMGDDWWFGVWQPPAVKDADPERLSQDHSAWTLAPDADWHGFGSLTQDYVMLDPIKVTILTPGIGPDGKMADRGVPAAIVSAFLRTKGVVVEKTGSYSFLVLFSIGITKGKSGTLLAELFDFREKYEANARLDDVLPDLVAAHPDLYRGLGLRDLCDHMHDRLRTDDLVDIQRQIYAVLPDPVMTPAVAYDHLVQGRVEPVRVEHLSGRVSAVMVVPYPPGIPVIMPGERFTDQTDRIIDYLAWGQDFDNAFAGFENEMHGIVRADDGAYTVNCLIDQRRQPRVTLDPET
jgi:lysine decarboxylase/arginine decarboxylase